MGRAARATLLLRGRQGMWLGLPSDDSPTILGDLPGCMPMLAVEDGDLTAGHGKPSKIVIVVRLAIRSPAPFHGAKIDGQGHGSGIGSVAVRPDANRTIDGQGEIRETRQPGRVPARFNLVPQWGNDEAGAIILGLGKRPFPTEPTASPTARIRRNVRRERRPDMSLKETEKRRVLVGREDKGRSIRVLQSRVIHGGAPLDFEKDNPFVSE